MPDFEAMRTAFGNAPANQHLGSTLLEASEGRARVAMPPRVELLQENGVVHGGYLSTLADTAAVYAVVSTLAEGQGITGVEFKVNFVRPGRLDGGGIEAVGSVVKAGRTLAVVDVEVVQGGVGRVCFASRLFLAVARASGGAALAPGHSLFRCGFSPSLIGAQANGAFVLPGLWHKRFPCSVCPEHTGAQACNLPSEYR